MQILHYEHFWHPTLVVAVNKEMFKYHMTNFLWFWTLNPFTVLWHFQFTPSCSDASYDIWHISPASSFSTKLSFQHIAQLLGNAVARSLSFQEQIKILIKQWLILLVFRYLSLHWYIIHHYVIWRFCQGRLYFFEKLDLLCLKLTNSIGKKICNLLSN